ncbi:MAG: hypothetical protein WC707_01940 [Candidatus Babeliaceae bacterium]|jgi:hypothetical protein
MTVSHGLLNVFHYLTRYETLKKIALGLLFAGAFAGGYGLYYWYSIRCDKEAQKIFAECLEHFERASASEDNAAWDDVVRAFDVGFDRYKKTSFGPYFLAFKADALVRLNKQAEAITTMGLMVEKLSTASPLYYLYAIKHALLKIDSSDTIIKSEGYADLEKLSEAKKNPYQDMALYYIGYNAYVYGDPERAQKVWTKLIRLHGASSIWSQMAQAKLEFTA